MKLQTYKEPIVWKPGMPLKPFDILEKEEVHERRLLHRSVHLLVINEHGKVICRRRSQNEQRYPGLLTTTFGTHVGAGESYRVTLQKNIAANIQAHWIGEFKVQDEHENEVCGLFVATRFCINNADALRFEEYDMQILNGMTNLTPHLIASLQTAGKIRSGLDKV